MLDYLKQFLYKFKSLVQSPTSSAEFYEYQTALSTVYYSLVDCGVCWDIFKKKQSGKIRIMHGKGSSSFPTDIYRIAPNLIPWSRLSLSEVKNASRLVTSDKVLSFNRKQSDVNNLLVEYGKRVNTYVDYQLNKNIMSSLFFAITKFLDIRCVNAVRLCAISINTAYIAHHLNIFRLFIKP
jgi:hypothetical protein